MGVAAVARRGQGGRAPRAVQVREGGCSCGAGSPEPNLCQRRLVSRCLLCLGASCCFIAFPAVWAQVRDTAVEPADVVLGGLAGGAFRPSRTVSAGLAGGVAEAANYLVARSPLSWVRGAGTAVVNEQLQHHPVWRYPTNPMAEPAADTQPRSVELAWGGAALVQGLGWALGVLPLCVSLSFLLLSTSWFYPLVRLFSPPALHAALGQIRLQVIFLRDFPVTAENQKNLVPSPSSKTRAHLSCPLHFPCLAEYVSPTSSRRRCEQPERSAGSGTALGTATPGPWSLAARHVPRHRPRIVSRRCPARIREHLGQHEGREIREMATGMLGSSGLFCSNRFSLKYSCSSPCVSPGAAQRRSGQGWGREWGEAAGCLCCCLES